MEYLVAVRAMGAPPSPIAATLTEIDADVIALQEVWSDETTNLAAELATELGYHHVFASGIDREGFGFGNALLSRWPIARSESTMLHENGVSHPVPWTQVCLMRRA